jgi:hypothetical protein
MKLISHRGNIRGSVQHMENKPSYIDTAISAGYDVEIDIRYINDKFYLGHDNPEYEVDLIWLEKRKDKLWLHCKDLESANKLQNLQDIKNPFMFFCHSSDPYVLTSNGFIWVHDLKLNLTNKSIIPLMTKEEIKSFDGNEVYAICTDNVIF